MPDPSPIFRAEMTDRSATVRCRDFGVQLTPHPTHTDEEQIVCVDVVDGTVAQKVTIHIGRIICRRGRIPVLVTHKGGYL